jgi:uncharacterized protein
MEFLIRPWPWYVAGPLIGLMAPLLLWLGNKQFGLSSNLRHMCAAVMPARVDFLRYDWRKVGGWNLVFVLGIMIGGFIGGALLANPEPIAISAATQADLAALGVTDFSGFVPREVFSWEGLLGARGILLVIVGGLLVGFGTAYAGGCTSGHGISGLGNLQLPSLIAVAAFFIGGILASFFLLPLIF